jgi:hypothetical protein
VDSREEFLRALARGSYDLILSDYNVPGFDGLSALHAARRFVPDLPFLFVSGGSWRGSSACSSPGRSAGRTSTGCCAGHGDGSSSSSREQPTGGCQVFVA